MADKNIGSLEAATEIQDDTLLVGEQQGVAVKIPAVLWKNYAQGDVAAALDAINGEVV